MFEAQLFNGAIVLGDPEGTALELGPAIFVPLARTLHLPLRVRAMGLALMAPMTITLGTPNLAAYFCELFGDGHGCTRAREWADATRAVHLSAIRQSPIAAVLTVSIATTPGTPGGAAGGATWAASVVMEVDRSEVRAFGDQVAFELGRAPWSPPATRSGSH